MPGVDLGAKIVDSSTLGVLWAEQNEGFRADTMSKACHCQSVDISYIEPRGIMIVRGRHVEMCEEKQCMYIY